MSVDSNALIPRTGIQPRLTNGPKAGQRSLYQQHVLDEDTYTDALSHIITRDFFPNLPHIHATNDYLTALTDNDPELLSASIRKLAALAHEKEHGRRSMDDTDAERARRTELSLMGTPYIALPGGRGRPTRTPVGARGWETPMGESSTRRRYDDYEELDGGETAEAGPSRPRKRPRPAVRDDLSLDAFQRNYTSEDNASFVQIVDEENRRRREERWGWAWEAEQKAAARRIEGEEKRKSILDAATSGNWVVNAEGRRLIGGLAEGGRDRPEGEAWKDIKLIGRGETITEGKENLQGEETGDTTGGSGALVVHTSGSSALVKTERTSAAATIPVTEIALPPKHPLTQALTDAGLPATALISKDDGAIVPHREITSGADQGRGRGSADSESRNKVERAAMGDQERGSLSLGGSGADMWGYTTRNNLMFPADSNTNPYPKPREAANTAVMPPIINHSNTRLPEEEHEPSGSRQGSRRGSSPARSWVDAAVRGTPYPQMPTINNYPLLANDPSPSPQDLPSLLTWGTLLSTPRALDGNDDPLDSTPSFKMPETKRRDEIGRKLADKASRAMNDRAKSFTPRAGGSALTAALRLAADKSRSVRGERTPGTMLPPSSTSRRQANSLTPAARQLLERSVGRSPMTSSGGLSTAGRNRGAVMEKGSGWAGLGGGGKTEKRSMSWTPSPRK
ncbi:hypothetical protein IAR55_004568 [Kwoniella newhampshirensis]|uniref:Protein DGCR14 n=1 Tax=Kwoniella newhampshirensis TaxID=1651941 RepID=A0AAW0YXW8_9TREE